MIDLPVRPVLCVLVETFHSVLVRQLRAHRVGRSVWEEVSRGNFQDVGCVGLTGQRLSLLFCHP